VEGKKEYTQEEEKEKERKTGQKPGRLMSRAIDRLFWLFPSFPCFHLYINTTRLTPLIPYID
jgi:hypothetical protein